jgi:ADP-ribosylglycohydrolase
MPLPTDTLDRIYAGFLGKAIGVRLGAPVEPTIWTWDRIDKTYGEITGYLRDFKNFAADDDTNGPVYFIRALRDFGLDPSPQDVGRTWLNYAAELHGMFWWGGYGISTEHTAFANLQSGVPAPESGSIARNGAVIAEQIGGQIFVDSWGWVCPGDPTRAADLAARAASVSHDGNGLYGARFVAAAIAKAFVAETIEEVVEAGLATVPAGSEYARVAHAVQAMHRVKPKDWRACRRMLEGEFGYDRYPGVCHIIPNAGLLILSLLYGQGDLSRTVEIATMGGWDTDCNAGNAGAIVGTLAGIAGVAAHYRKPINDGIVASGITGSLNIVDIPSFCRELAVLAHRLAGEEPPADWAADMERRGVRFDFDLPGSTHGFRTAPDNRIALSWSDERKATGRGALCALLDRLERGDGGRIFWKPFYRRSDFDDERYRPMFSPVVATGQEATLRLWLDPWEGDGHLRIVPYVRRAMSGRIDEIGAWTQPAAGEWQELRFTVPETGGEAVDEIGIKVEYFGRLKFLGRIFIDEFTIGGTGSARLDPRIETNEWGGITRCTWNRGVWKIEDGRIHALTATDADLWTGHLYARDQTVTAEITPLAGEGHLVCARGQGNERCYAAGFVSAEEVAIIRRDFGETVLARAPFRREFGRTYSLALEAMGDRLALSVDGKVLLEARDGTLAYGMAGLRLPSAGRMQAGVIEIREAAHG